MSQPMHQSACPVCGHAPSKIGPLLIEVSATPPPVGPPPLTAEQVRQAAREGAAEAIRERLVGASLNPAVGFREAIVGEAGPPPQSYGRQS